MNTIVKKKDDRGSVSLPGSVPAAPSGEEAATEHQVVEIERTFTDRWEW